MSGGEVPDGPGAAEVVEAVAGLVVPSRPLDPGSVQPTFDWRHGASELIAVARRERLTGALVEAVERGVVAINAHDEERLLHDHAAALAWTLRVEDRMCDVVERLAASGVGDVRIVKGPAIAHLDEIEPSLRTFGDLDLLVRSSDLDATVAVLAGMGARRPYSERRPGFDRRFAKSVTLTFEDGVEVDVHRTICDGVHGVRVPVDSLFERPEPFTVAGMPFAALDLHHRLLHAAYHAVLGSPVPKLMSRRDIVGYLHRTDGEVGAVAAEAARWGGTAVLAEAVTTALALAPGVAPHWRRWLDGTTADPAEAAIVAAQRRDGSSYGWSRLRMLREMGSWSDRLAYAWAVAVPTAEHLGSRGRARGDLLRRAAARAIGRDDRAGEDA